MKNLRAQLLFIALLLLGAVVPARAGAYTVNSNADTTDGTCDAANCTLREAILAVNADGSGSISFAIGSGPATINILTEMPAMTVPVVLDATTQPGFAGTPIIRLRSTAHVSAAITVKAGDTTVRGFDIGDVGRGIQVTPSVAVSNIAIERNFIAVDPAAALTGEKTSIYVASAFQANVNLTIGNGTPSGRNVLGGLVGIILFDRVQAVIAGNHLGIADDGSTALPAYPGGNPFNGLIDVRVFGTGSAVIGGPTAGARNVIGTGSGNGIHILAHAPTHIEGNYIGVDASGMLPRPNGLIAVSCHGAHDVTVVNNVIVGGPNGTGVSATNGSMNTIIRGNFIGTDATGNTVLATKVPVTIQGTLAPTIGGTTPADRNVINGGSVAQIEVFGSSGDTVIAGNYIGVTLAGAPGTPSTYGVWLRDGNSDATFTARPHTIGGSALGAGNVIAGSTSAAINLEMIQPVMVRGNRIGTNPAGTAAVPTSGYGIRIALDGSHGNTGSHAIGGVGPNDGNTISGIQVNGANTGYGIAVLAGTHTILGNRIGTDVTGNASIANAGGGILVSGTGTTSATIGGTAAGAGNLISGNPIGINVLSDPTVTILGNRIGTNAAGTAGLGNGTGISTNMTAGSTKAIAIGGAVAGAGNLISGNSTGVSLTNGGAISIAGNRIGTNDAGAAALANQNSNIEVVDATVAIGGASAGARNVISGALHGAGILLRATVGTTNATITGNYIGTDMTGSAAIPNGAVAITCGTANVAANITGNLISGGVSMAPCTATIRGNYIGTDATGTAPIASGSAINGIVIGGGSTIGGVAAGDGNVIAYQPGAAIRQLNGTGTSYLGNSIHSNGGLAIDLAGNGVTANDAGDGDTGVNNLQNFPVLLSAVSGGGATTVSGSLNSIANTVFVIELFSNAAADPSGFGEAQTLLGRTTALTDASGNAGFNLTLPPVAAGHSLSATATNQTTNDTSELSANVTVGAPGTFQFSAATTSVGEGAGNVTLTVTRTGGSLPATVDYTTSNGTALAGSDYTATGGTLSFAAADTSKTIVIPITSDTIDEVDETFSVTLSNAGGATIGAPSTEVVTIADDDAAPSISAANASVAEGNSGTTTLTFNVSLTAASTQTVTVDYTTGDGTANAGSDYGMRFGTLTFAPGDTGKTVAVTINGDGTAETDEMLQLVLSNAGNATIAGAPATGTIMNDDGPPAITIGDVTVIEGNSGSMTASVVVSLSNPSSSPVTVDYATNANTASSSSDFTTASGMLTFTPGVMSQTIAITIAGDTVVEGNESLFVNLTNAANGTIADAQSVVTIADDDGSPSLTISDVAVNEAAGSAAVTVLLAPASAQSVTVQYATTDAAASAGSDYTSANGTLTFNAGETAQTITVPIANDAFTESAEMFTIALSSPANASIANGNATVTIIDDDPTPTITIGDVSAIEGSAATFTVALSNPSASTVTVSYATTAGSATSGSDYTAASGTLTYQPGETSKQVIIATTVDAVRESDETYFVDLFTATNATIVRSRATGTIVDDDGTPALVISDATVAEGNSGTVSAIFTVTLAGNTAQSVTVDYATANGTAAAGSDYAATSGQLTFAAGVTTRTISVPVVGDLDVESDETFFVNLSNPANATIADSQALGTITNDDTTAVVPSIAIEDMNVVEGNSGTTAATFTVTLSAPTTHSVTVGYATANGTATSGSDYAASSGTLVFAPGVTSQTIAIAVAGDTAVEPNEGFVVNLSSPSNATIADGQGAGTILNDDSPAIVPAITIDNVTVAEGNGGTTNATFAVTLSSATTNTVTVDFATANGTAGSGSDYAANSGTLVFAPGATSKTITIAVAGDTLVEPDETFFVDLTNAGNATIADAQGLGTVLNDDSAAVVPSIAIGDATVAEGDAGTTNATFIVTLTAATTSTITVDYATANGTATSGSDYAANSGTLAFAPGVMSQIITIAVAGDTLVETNESFLVSLSNSTNATVADAQGLGTITNDDSASTLPSIVINDVTVAEGNLGATTARFTVRLNAASASAVTVSYATSNGGAEAGGDYAESRGSLVFAPGVTSQIIGVAVVGDVLIEPDESFFVTLSHPAGATLSRARGTGTIVNDDFQASLPSITIAGTSVAEGDRGTTKAAFVVTLSTATTLPVTVDFESADGTALAGIDYERAHGTLLFNPGEVEHTIDVPVIGDAMPEADETFSVRLSSAVNATLAADRADGTIRDDDGARVRAVVVIAGAGPGVGGAFFRTQLVLHDPTGDAISGNLVIHPMGGGATRTFGYALRPYETRDVGAEMDMAGFGSIDIVPLTGGLPEVSVHVFNDGGERGTTGFNVALVSSSAAIGEGQHGVLLTPVSASAFRYNVGARALESGADVTFVLRRASGEIAAQVTRSFASHELAQFSAAALFGTPLEGADSIGIVVTRGSAIVYGSAIDNISQDPSFLVAHPLP